MSAREQKSDHTDFGEKALAAFVGIGPSLDEQKKVLVIDDDPVTVRALTLLLNKQGYAVISASNSSEAGRVVREEHPDMLLVDVNLTSEDTSEEAMPMDGFQLTRWLQHVSARKIPAIMISARDNEDYKRYAARVGAETFMAKPLNDAVLFQSIESALASQAPIKGGFARL